MGWERLDELFEAHPNLYIDTSSGCMLPVGDTMYPNDRDFLRRFFLKWSDRVIFGADAFWGRRGDGAAEPRYYWHINFLKALDLPCEILDKICHGNIERLCRIAPLDEI